MSYLIFMLRDSRYAVEARAVREIVSLPEITPLGEASDYVAGVVNLRGKIVPVLDLNLRLGHPPRRWNLDDCLIILEWDGSTVGLIVNEAQNVREFAPDEVIQVPSYGATSHPRDLFLAGLLKSAGHVVMLLHLENLLCLAHGPTELRQSGGIVPSAIQGAVCSDSTPLERAVFRERALSLAQPPVSWDLDDLLPRAVVRLGEEFFGIDLLSIREFADLGSVTPVPCCPKHVVGEINLRGDLITLMEIFTELGLDPLPGRTGSKVLVVNNAELRAGVLVDDVLEVLYIRAADVKRANTAARGPGKDYLQGTVPYEAQILCLLDLPVLLMQESLTVNEKP